MAEIIPGQGYPARGGGSESSSKKSGVANGRFSKSVHNADDGAGNIYVSLGTVPTGSTWLIERMLCETDSTTSTTYTIYENLDGKSNRRSFTPAGNNDEADYNSPLYFQGGSEVIGVWTGASAGSIGYCNFQVREV